MNSAGCSLWASIAPISFPPTISLCSPGFFLFFCGTYIGRWARNGKFPDFTYRLRFTSLSWMGRHALILYLIHQPLIFGVCTLISWIISL
mgnify:CR=1 FL=1